MAGQKKSDLVQYVEQQKNKSFAEKDFNTTDGLVLAELSYINWEKLGIDYPADGSMTLKDVIGKMPEKIRSELDENTRELLTAVADSERFGNMLISNYCEAHKEKQEDVSYEDLKQFAAVTFTYTDGEGNIQNYIAYRGTDGTLEGWCEDFNMAYDTMTEAQRCSVEYLNEIASKLEGGIRVGGHSKGGNNAVYAFLFCDEQVRSRIQKIYSYDGPGMTEGICYIDADGNTVPLDPEIYQQMLELLKGSAVCPYDSVIGQLLNENDFVFVNTDEKILADHNAYTWKIDPETGEFERREQSDFSKYLNDVLDDWVFGLPMEYRKTFLNIVWDWIYSQDAANFDAILTKLKENPFAVIEDIASFVKACPEVEQKQFEVCFVILLLCTADNYLEIQISGYEIIKEKIKAELTEREIFTPEDLWLCLKENPMANSMDFLQSLLSDWDTLKAMTMAVTDIAFDTFISQIVQAAMKGALNFVMANIAEIAMLAAVIIVCVIAVRFIKEHWDEIVDLAEKISDYLQEKISEFAEAMKLVIIEESKKMLSEIVYQVERFADLYEDTKDIVIQTVHLWAECTARNIQNVVRIYGGISFALIRTAVGCTQPPVTIDMVRLQAAVDQMSRLANRVGNIDGRLNTLYSKLCVNNIEQGEGVMTSLVNLYHITRADINVDEGNRIRRKANAISSLYQGYYDAERQILAKIGG